MKKDKYINVISAALIILSIILYGFAKVNSKASQLSFNKTKQAEINKNN